jgi:hypothetical protein
MAEILGKGPRAYDLEQRKDNPIGYKVEMNISLI